MAVRGSLTAKKENTYRLRAAVKWMLYALCAVLCVYLRLSFYMLGVRLSPPMLLTGAVSAVGMREGMKRGAVFGLLCGLFSDAAGGHLIYADVLIYALTGFFAGMLAARLCRVSFFLWLPTAALFSFPVYAAVFLGSAVLNFADTGNFVFTLSFPRAVLYPTLLTAVLSAPFYPPVLWIASMTHKKKKHTALRPALRPQKR